MPRFGNILIIILATDLITEKLSMRSFILSGPLRTGPNVLYL